MIEKNSFPLLFVLTFLFGILPFALYQYEISHGMLSTATQWYEQNNHGPWRYSNEGLLIFTPQLILALLALISVVVKFFKKDPVSENEARNIILFGTFLILMQIIIFGLQLYYIGWTFD